MKFVKREADYELDCYAEYSSGEGRILCGTIMQSEAGDWGFIQRFDGDRTLVLNIYAMRAITQMLENIEFADWEKLDA